MTTDGVLDYLGRRLPVFRPTGQPEPLTGGLLNRVWRVPGRPEPVIVKHAPDRVGDLPLDPFRLTIEARALGDFGKRPAGLCDERVRTPRLLDFDEATHTLVMEDVGALPPLDTWLRMATPVAAAQRGSWLGGFIGRLHHRTAHDAGIAARFVNLPIQQTRLAVQYRSIESSLAAVDVRDAEKLGRKASALGEKLLQPGRCLVMGDLWPRSVLVRVDGLRVIDWEMAHFGQPFQDYAHLAAHLWMLAHRGVSAARDFARGFVEAYEAAAPPESSGDATDGALHAGCEIVVRALGPFQQGYLYDGLASGSGRVREAVERAAAWMRDGVPNRIDLFRGF